MTVLTHEEAKKLRDSDHSLAVLKLIFDVEQAVLSKLAAGVRMGNGSTNGRP
jgi:hypothetical protein